MLSGIGLSRRQEELYRRILDRPGQSVEDLAIGEASGSPEDAGPDLERLLWLGLITHSSDDPARYVAVAPDAAVKRLVNGRIDAARMAEREIDGLMTAFWAGRQSSDGRGPTDLAGLVEVVTGTDDVDARLEQLRGSVHRSIRAFASPSYPGGVLREGADASRPGGTVARRVIYPRDALEAPERFAAIVDRIAAGEDARIHPEIPAVLTLFDTFAAGLDVSIGDDHPRLLIVHRSRLLACLSALFESYWASAVPVRPESDGCASARTIPEPNATIAALLAGGMTDEAIGHALGISPSTVYRRVHEVMTALGASARFQAGFRLARRQSAVDDAGAPPIPRPRAAQREPVGSGRHALAARDAAPLR